MEYICDQLEYLLYVELVSSCVCGLQVAQMCLQRLVIFLVKCVERHLQASTLVPSRVKAARYVAFTCFIFISTKA